MANADRRESDVAGQPKTTARKITELEAKAEEVFNLISDYIPERYEGFEGPFEEADPLCQCWNKALWTATDAIREMGALAAMLRAKAGVSDPIDFERYPKIAKIRGQGESTQAVACCEKGTTGRIRMAAEAQADGLISPTNGESFVWIRILGKYCGPRLLIPASPK